MYYISNNGSIYHNGTLVSLNESKVVKSAKDGIVFVNNLLYESRLMGLSIPDTKKNVKRFDTD